MQLKSEVLAELIEPALFALRQPKAAAVIPIAQRARDALRRAQSALRDSGPIHIPSFELGVATSLSGLLGTAAQRSGLNDKIQAVSGMTKGLETLHQIALISRSASEATQGELADRIGVDRGNFNRRIRRLQDADLVESRRRGQRRVYALTPLGFDVLTEMRPGWRARHPTSLESVLDEERARDVAKSLVSSIGAEIGAGNIDARTLNLAEFVALYPKILTIRGRSERSQKVQRVLSFEAR